jgi:hypothetical protein
MSGVQDLVKTVYPNLAGNKRNPTISCRCTFSVYNSKSCPLNKYSFVPHPHGSFQHRSLYESSFK